MTDTQNIPLNKLVPWEGNVRKTSACTSLGELESSIAAHGLLQSLVVRKKGKAKFAVIAGGRRLQALKHLAANERIPADHPVSCRVINGKADALEISLTENTVREQMHPADEFEAFRDLIENGLPPADVAARFGVTEHVVLKRLKLGRVSPVILEAYRKDDLTLAQVMAFAVSDDHAAQDNLFENLSAYNDDPEDIREALTQDEIPATDRRVRFVTLQAYEQAGGKTRCDLFSSDENGIFILDPDLLERLVFEKLEQEAAAIRAEGWKWVEIRPSFDYEEWSDCQRAYERAISLTTEQQAEYNALESELDSFYDIDGELTEEQEARAEAIRERMDELDDRDMHWPPETLAIAGVVLTIDRNGALDPRCGFIRPEDQPQDAEDSPDPDRDEAENRTKALYPASLIENLTAHKTVALAASLASEPEVALATIVHAFALRVFYGSGHTGTCLEFLARAQSFRRTGDSQANQEIEKHKALWDERLPEESADLWKWCLRQRRDMLMELLAVCAACTVNAVQAKADRPDCERLIHANDLAEALTLDMTGWFTPTADNYFRKINKAQILEAITEAKGAPPAPIMAKLKKGELAAAAEQAVAGTGWLPEILRIPADDSSIEEIEY